ALAHSLESLWSKSANPVSAALAQDAIRGIFEHLPRVANDPKNLEARTGTMLAALHAGLAFSNTMTGPAHALSYAMTFRKGTPHGMACALFLGAIIDVVVAQGDSAAPILLNVLGPRPGDRVRELLASLGVRPFAAYDITTDDRDALRRSLAENPR